MDIPPKVIPHEVGALVDDLQHRGYSITEKSYDQANFGDAIIGLERGATKIRIVRDRAFWYVVIGAADYWFSAEIWRAFLEASMPPVEIVPLAVQAGWLLEDLGRIEVMSDLTKRQLAKLDDWQSRKAAARLKLPPALWGRELPPEGWSWPR